MNFIARMLRRLFGQRTKVNELAVVFHKDANSVGEHGTIRVNHVHMGLSNYRIRFAFMGVRQAPKLDKVIMDFIWHQAECAGYEVLELCTYETVAPVIQYKKNQPGLPAVMTAAASTQPPENDDPELEKAQAQFRAVVKQAGAAAVASEQ